MDRSGTTDGVVAYSGARLFDGERAVVNHAVLVKDGMVLDVVPYDSVPQAVTHYREQDCTLLPGLIDIHVHFMRWQGSQFLASGVTTVRDAGNSLKWILDRRGEWEEKRWPRILCLGPLLDGPAPVHEVVGRPCTDLAAAVIAVQETVKAGVDGVKFYVGLPPEWLPAMVKAGHAAGRRVSMHCAGGGALAAARAGVDEFFHLAGILTNIWPAAPPGWLDVWGLPEFGRTIDRQRAVADRIRASGITATPTLAYWDSQWRIRTADPLEQLDLRRTPPAMVEWQKVPFDRASSDQWRRAMHAAQSFVGLLLERDVPVLAGSDVPCGPVPPGRSLWRELSLLAGAGMSPLQALRAATSDAGQFLGRRDLGRLTPGSTADMVFVRGNPLAAIPSQPDIASIVRNGSVLRPEDLLITDQESLADEPWAVQFKRHWEKQSR
jgi:imidazolonepropionase-like amidohydrolase